VLRRASSTTRPSLLSHFPKSIYQKSHARFSSFYFSISVIYRSSKQSASILRRTMLRSSIIRPLVKGWIAPSLRCFSRHQFAPPTFLPSPRERLCPGKARYPDIRACGVHKNASSEEQPSDFFTDNYTIEDGGSSSYLHLSFLALFFFILGACRRRGRREAEPPVDAN
jgi:hypothetical protein